MVAVDLIEMLDDTDLSVEANAAVTAKAVAGYVNGRFENWPAIVLKWGTSGKHLLSIDVQGNPAAGAQCLDVERGDANIDQAASWSKETMAAGRHYRDLRWYPKVYVQESNAAALVAAMTAAGFNRADWRLWTAHYGWKGGAHLCGPSTCGCKVQADATQWTNTFDGVSLDASVCTPGFFDGPPALAPVKPPVVDVEVPKVVGLVVSKAVADLKAVGFDVPSSPPVTYIVTAQNPVALAKAARGSHVVLMGEAPKPVVPVDPPKPATPVTKPITVVEAPKPVVPPVTPVAPVVVPTVPVAPVTPAPKAPVVVSVYVQQTLTAAEGAKAGYPEGTIVYIPHTVTEAA